MYYIHKKTNEFKILDYIGKELSYTNPKLNFLQVFKNVIVYEHSNAKKVIYLFHLNTSE